MGQDRDQVGKEDSQDQEKPLFTIVSGFKIHNPVHNLVKMTPLKRRSGENGYLPRSFIYVHVYMYVYVCTLVYVRIHKLFRTQIR